MLMVTSSMRMLDGVHGNTSDSWPVVSLSLVLEPGVDSLQEGLVSSLSTGHDSDHGSAVAHDGLSGSGWESHSGSSAVLGVTDDDSRSSGGSGEAASVSELGLAVRDDGSLGQGVHGEDVSDGEGSCRTVVRECTGLINGKIKDEL